MTAQADFEAVPILTMAMRIGRAIDNERRKLVRERGPDAARVARLTPGVARSIGYDDGLSAPSWSLVGDDGSVSTFWGRAPSA